MYVRDEMTKDLITINANDVISKAEEIMSDIYKLVPLNHTIEVIFS